MVRFLDGFKFHKIRYTNIFPSILTDTDRPRKSGPIALPSDPMPSPRVMGASALRQICSLEIHLTEVRPAQVHRAQARALGANQSRGAAFHAGALGAHRPRTAAPQSGSWSERGVRMTAT